MTIEKTELSRRSLVKGAAWSLPVIAVAAATPMAAASVATSDLVPVLGGPINLTLTALGLPVASINVVNTLTILNNGTSASVAGATATVSYDSALLTLNVVGAGVDVIGTDGTYTLDLPSIPAGGSLVINLGTTLDSLLDVSLLVGSPTMDVVVSGDGNTTNNTASSPLGITLLG